MLHFDSLTGSLVGRAISTLIGIDSYGKGLCFGPLGTTIRHPLSRVATYFTAPSHTRRCLTLLFFWMLAPHLSQTHHLSLLAFLATFACFLVALSPWIRPMCLLSLFDRISYWQCGHGFILWLPGGPHSYFFGRQYLLSLFVFVCFIILLLKLLKFLIKTLFWLVFRAGLYNYYR